MSRELAQFTKQYTNFAVASQILTHGAIWFVDLRNFPEYRYYNNAIIILFSLHSLDEPRLYLRYH